MNFIKRYLKMLQENLSTVEIPQLPNPMNCVSSESGRVGYIIAWLFGVPASLLFVIFLIRGH